MADRYFVETPIDGFTARLAGPEAHHLIHVMRAKPGTRAVLFDDTGAEFAAAVTRVDRATVELQIEQRTEVDRELPLEIVLAVALPKGDRQRWLIEKATELGLSRIVPLKTERGVAQPVEQAVKRLRRTVVEASKQCGRNRLMQIDTPADWPDFVATTQDVPSRLVAHPNGYHAAPGPLSVASLPRPVLLAIGPEGGFTDEEIAIAVTAGWHTVDLGPRILRVETAALLLSTLVAHAHVGK